MIFSNPLKYQISSHYYVSVWTFKCWLLSQRVITPNHWFNGLLDNSQATYGLEPTLTFIIITVWKNIKLEIKRFWFQPGSSKVLGNYLYGHSFLSKETE